MRKIALALVALLMAGCGGQQKKEAEKKQRGPVQAPEVYRVLLETSKGNVEIEVTRAWAPRGADRFYELVTEGYYNGVRLHRVVRNFIVQFGIHPDPAISRLWGNMRIPDDPRKERNRKGTVAFAMAGPASRTTQVFINLRDNKSLDESGFVPFGRVVSGMENVERFYTYGEVAPRGQGPDPNRMETEGDAYVERAFPRLDRIEKAGIMK